MAKELGAKAQRTRDHILAQGMALMKEKGFRGTTIRDICEAAEVSVGTFYAYFKDKGELFQYSFSKKGPAFAEFLTGTLTEGAPAEKIMSFVRYYAWLNVGTDREELTHMFLRPDSNWFPGNHEAYDVLYAIVREGQEAGQLTRRLTAGDIVSMLRVFLRGCVYEWIMGGFNFELEPRMSFFAGQLVRSFSAE